MKKFKDRDMQLLLGQVLRAGTLISIGVVFIGGIFYLLRHGQTHETYSVFSGIPDYLQHPSTLLRAAAGLSGQAIIQIGIVLLILTPIFRVAFSAFGFVLEKDYMYVGISVLVLLIIFTSLMTGKAG